MKIVVVATRRADASPDQLAPHLEAEVKTALGFMVEDFVREIYSRVDGKGAILVLEAAGEDEARSRLAELPLARAGLLDFDLYPVQVYRGIAAAAEA